MSTNPETTPAIARAAEENPRAYLEWNTAFMSGEPIEPASVYVSRRTLAAALDVEEMAQVLSRASWPDGCHDGFPGKRVAGMLATALRAAILGGDS